MEHENLLQCSQEPATGFYSEPVETSSQILPLGSILISPPIYAQIPQTVSSLRDII